MFDCPEPRFESLIRQAISLLDLDLSGMRVVTEAASGFFLCTPVIAAMAGADVVAVGRDSRHGRFSDIRAELERLGRNLGIDGRITCTDNRADPRLRGVDIVTNLGFLRPLDARFLEHVGHQAVVSYMCEAWETRDGDVDFDYCRTAGIPVYFSDEDGWGMGVFSMCGLLAVKLCLEAGIEVIGNRIAVLSSDRFGPVVRNALAVCGADAILVKGPDYKELGDSGVDAIVVAEYSTGRQGILGEIIPIQRLAQALAPGGAIVQIAGNNAVSVITCAGYTLYPVGELPPQKMARTLEYLGPLPVVRLNAIGLKVGWAGRTGRKKGLVGEGLDEFVLANAPAQIRRFRNRPGQEA